MMQHFLTFIFPSHWDGQANQLSEMHSREERKGGEEEEEEGEGRRRTDCLLLSYISLKSVPDHLALSLSHTSCKKTHSSKKQSCSLLHSAPLKTVPITVPISLPATLKNTHTPPAQVHNCRTFLFISHMNFEILRHISHKLCNRRA